MMVIDISLVAVILLSCLHFVPHRHWFFEITIYFSQQLFIFLAALLVFKVGFANTYNLTDFVLIVVSAICAGYHFLRFLPYTSLGKIEVPWSDAKAVDSRLSLFIANVYQENKKYHLVGNLIKKWQPDIVVLLETDTSWVENVLKELGQDTYPYSILKPQSDTYGMVLLSKNTILEGEVQHITDVPSIHAKLKVSDYEIDFVVLHPEPPAPGEAETSLPKDREILGVATRVKEFKGPVIVTGDLNEVAWSNTSLRFLQTSGLLDPRKGRYILSTFPVYLPFFRFPLDHIFCSHHFRIRKFTRLAGIGSDHYPLYIELTL